ncbi:MAG: hypothetical protein E7352_05685 [Clostridiales bacterium]|nr:hypothetical protein [Clostridiales bacterium]MBE5747642.1 hypothetical protein [Clostridiales bacterium]
MENKIENVVDNEQNKVNNSIEKCVICGVNTPYRFSTPISQREFYVEGVGQICQHCYYDIFIKKSRG